MEPVDERYAQIIAMVTTALKNHGCDSREIKNDVDEHAEIQIEESVGSSFRVTSHGDSAVKLEHVGNGTAAQRKTIQLIRTNRGRCGEGIGGYRFQSDDGWIIFVEAASPDESWKKFESE